MKTERVYNKLVRDNIPNIIKQNGENPVIRVLSSHEYKIELEKKLNEEYQEVLNSSGNARLMELADMLEVIRALAEIEKSSLEEIISYTNEKGNKNGYFKEKIFLEKVIVEE